MPSLHVTIKVLSLATSFPLNSTTRTSPPFSLAPILLASDLKAVSVFQSIAKPALMVFLPFLSRNPPRLLLANRYQVVATQDTGTATRMLEQTRRPAAQARTIVLHRGVLQVQVTDRLAYKETQVLEAAATPAVTMELTARALTPIAKRVARTVVRYSLATATDSLNPSPLLHLHHQHRILLYRAPLKIKA
jgi:hypothetical protein